MVLLESLWADFCVAACFLFAALYFWFTLNFDFWEKKNVPFVEPSIPFGNFGKSFLGKISFTAEFHDFYRKFKPNGFGGVYSMRSPIFVVCTPELMKQVLTKDFNSFHDRGIPYDEENDPFSANLFNLGGQRWKDLRAKLSPTFTSGKIKGMFPLIFGCAKELKECIQTQIKKNDSVEMQDLLVRFTTDVIGTCAFGIECNSLKDPNAEFHQMGRALFKANTTNSVRAILFSLFPKLFSKLGTFKRVFSKYTTFFKQVMDDTVRHRRKSDVERNDFVQLMMRVMDEENSGIKFTQDTMAAQAFLFFAAGLDNVSNNIGFCLHAMALDQELQETVHHEIVTALSEYGGEMCYEAVGKMDLMSRVIDEGLRMYTPAGVLIRKVTEDKYKVPGTDIELEGNSAVFVPIQSMHLDEEIFPDPYKFDPNRFTEEEKMKRHPFAYIPFGEGPRFCIASRFAQLEMRLCFAELIRHFNFSVAPETDISLELDPTNFSPTPKQKFWLRVTERQAMEVHAL